jgi:hypothetical protein
VRTLRTTPFRPGSVSASRSATPSALSRATPSAGGARQAGAPSTPSAAGNGGGSSGGAQRRPPHPADELEELTVLRDKSVQIWFDEPLLFAKLQDYVMNTPIVCVVVVLQRCRPQPQPQPQPQPLPLPARRLRATASASARVVCPPSCVSAALGLAAHPAPTSSSLRRGRYDLTRKCETGIPPWCVFLPSWGFPYNPKARRLYTILMWAVSIAMMLFGLFDLTRKVPWVREFFAQLNRPLLDWLDEHIMPYLVGEFFYVPLHFTRILLTV